MKKSEGSDTPSTKCEWSNEVKPTPLQEMQRLYVEEYEMSKQFELGDTVILSSGWGTLRTITSVDRVTGTMAFVKGSSRRFNRKSGHETGGGSFGRISWATPEDVASVENENKLRELRRIIEDIDWRKLPAEVLEEVLSVVDRFEIRREK